jgi:tetratricopeptide (TPR) repeat protein
MKIALPKLHPSHLTANEDSLRQCQLALEHKDRESYQGAQDAMRRYWRGVGERPQTERLRPSVAAEVLLCVGILTGWIGSKIQIKEAQETAKDLISESLTYFESVGDQKKVAAARVELAYCYWRAGEANEAQTMLREALKTLTTEGTTRARALLKLSTVEWTAARYHEALEILTTNAAIFQKLTNHTVRGGYHAELAIVFRNLATAENEQSYFQRAISEYQEADHQFKLARNPIFRADVKNNVGFLLFKLSRFKESHKYLEEARRLTVSFRDRARTAQIDETRAQVLIAEGKYKEAETVASRAVWALEKSGHQRLVACALITEGIAVARLGRTEHAQLIFQKAIEVAFQVEALSAAGLAALTMTEEVDQLSPAMLKAAYQQAREWLASTQSPDILRRLNEAAGKVEGLPSSLTAEEAIATLLAKPGALEDRIREYENALVKEALIQANGSVTIAASLLGTSYQALGYMLETRHKNLAKVRSPIRRRTKKS